MCLPRFAKPRSSEPSPWASTLLRVVTRTAADVLFEAEIAGEAALVDDEIGELKGHALRENGAGAVGDVGEGAAVDQGGCALGGLDEVGEEGVGEQRHHGADGVELRGVNGFA